MKKVIKFTSDARYNDLEFHEGCEYVLDCACGFADRWLHRGHELVRAITDEELQAQEKQKEPEEKHEEIKAQKKIVKTRKKDKNKEE